MRRIGQLGKGKLGKSKLARQQTIVRSMLTACITVLFFSGSSNLMAQPQLKNCDKLDAAGLKLKQEIFAALDAQNPETVETLCEKGAFCVESPSLSRVWVKKRWFCLPVPAVV